MVRVITAYLEKFNYPAQCVSCGQPPGSGSLSVGKRKSSGKYQHSSLSMSFPLCDTDAGIHGSFSKRLKPLSLASSLSSLVFIVVVALLLKFINDKSSLRTLLIALAALSAIIFLAVTILRVRLMNENKESFAAYKKISRSVKIAGFAVPSLINKKGVVKLDFEDAGYANDFAQMNEGVLPGK